MKITKSELIYIGQVILTWTFVNIAVNMLGLWFSKLLNAVEFTYLESITNEFVKPILIQSFLFGFCLLLGYQFLKDKKKAIYVFTILQIIVFHIILFLSIKIHHGLHFVSTFNNFGLQYLSNCGQYLVDVLYVYFPIDGTFDNGKFLPVNFYSFYLHWIFLNLVYYFGLTWSSVKLLKLFTEKSVESVEI
jgi:hypothetical protein